LLCIVGDRICFCAHVLVRVFFSFFTPIVSCLLYYLYVMKMENESPKIITNDCLNKVSPSSFDLNQNEERKQKIANCIFK
jgi:hypothetical protein